jgi:Asp-tRNA(Asn)/Glu-tRNA(Gln) amidotransferase A subunit family amidase
MRFLRAACITLLAMSVQAATEFDVTEKSIAELQDALTSGRVTSRDVVTRYLARIEAYDRGGPRLNAIIAVNPRAIADAEALDRERREKGVRGPLHGIPIVIKDNFETADLPTTGGSIALAGFMTGRDAFQVKKLRDAGAIIIAKTNLHELAAGITTISSLGGQTRNPYDPARNPGGSSGGTAAAVAASFAAAGMGSDTCGSIRIPAAFNNLYGLRVTPGVSGRSGVIPLSHTQDVAGPLARSVADLVTMLDVTVGEDPGDAVTVAGRGHVPGSYRAALDRDALRGKRIGLLKNLVEDGEVADINRKALQAMKAAGADVVEEITIPGLEDLLRDSSAIPHEFKFDLMDYLAHFPNAPVHSLGEILARGGYDKALENTFRTRERPEARDTDASRRARVRREATRALVFTTMEEMKLDALAYPPTQRKPAITGEPQSGLSNCQLSASAGFPAMSMPAGFTSDRVPIGIELLGRPWEELKLLSIAYAYEQAVQPRRAPLATPPLVNGKAPQPRSFRATADGMRVDFTFDVTTGRLTYAIAGEKPMAAAIHRADDGDTGPVIAALRDVSGTVTLNGAEGSALGGGKLYVNAVAYGKLVKAVIGPTVY